MADLTQSLADLTDAVDAIGVRFQGLVVPLQEALEAAQTALAAALNDALAAAAAAGDEIESQVTELNAIGTPVEPTPEA